MAVMQGPMAPLPDQKSQAKKAVRKKTGEDP
jgi:hypothetical protein